MTSHALFLPDPDLEIGGRGGGRSFRPLYKGEGQSLKSVLALRASLWSGSATANGLLAKTVGMRLGQ